MLEIEKSKRNPQHSFLQLPYEIRLQIYDEVFFHNNPDRIINAWKSDSIDFWGPGVTGGSPPFDSRFTCVSLLRTCRAIYQEARNIFYRSLTLQFTLDQGRGMFTTFWPREDARKYLAIPPASRKLVEKVEICMFFVSQHTHEGLQREWDAITNVVADDFTSLKSLKIEGPCKYTPWSLRDCPEGMFNHGYSKQRLYIEPLLRINRLQHFDIDHFTRMDTHLLLCGMKLEEVVRTLTGSTQRVGAMRFSGL